jgi:predicted nucleic acid-binding protein
MYILDTNILIYMLSDNEKVMLFLHDLKQEQYGVSAVTAMEFLCGARKEGRSIEEMESYLMCYRTYDVSSYIARRAALLYKGKNSAFKDLIIAATAIEHKATLITADREFLKFPELKVCLLEL